MNQQDPPILPQRSNLIRERAYTDAFPARYLHPTLDSSNRTLLAALFCGVLTAALDIAMIGPAIPAVQEWFDVSARQVSWVSAAFTLCSLGGVPVMGWLADNYSRRAVLIAAIMAFITGAVVVAVSPTFSVLLVGRCFQGLAAAGIFPTISAIVGDAFSESGRGKALGVLGSVFGVAFIIGPVLAGIIIQYSWQWLFLIAVPLGAFAAVFVLRTLPRMPASPATRRLDVAGLIVFVSIVACLAYALNRLDADQIMSSVSSAGVLVPVGLILVLVPMFIVLENRAASPVVRLSLFKSRDVRAAVLMAVGAGMCEAAMVFTPLLAITAYGVDKSAASFMFLPLALAVAIGSPIFGRMIDRAGVRAVAASACTFLLVGLAGYVSVSSSMLLFYTCSVFIGFGLAGLLGSTLNYVMLRAAESSERTTTQGFVTLALNMGLSLGATVVGALVTSSRTPLAGFRNAFLTLVVVSAGLVLLSIALPGRATVPGPRQWSKEAAESGSD